MQQREFGDGAFSATRQVQFLNLMAHNDDFFQYAQDIPMELSDFTIPACQLVYEVLSNYYRKFAHAPKFGTLEAMVADAVTTGQSCQQSVQTELTPEEYDSLSAVMDQVHKPPQIDTDYGQSALFEHVKDVRTKQVMAKYQEAVHSGISPDAMLKELAAISSLQSPASAVKLYHIIGDADQALTLTKEELAKVPTGLSILDSAILGGLDANIEELGIGVACTGIGKTNMLLNFALGAAQADVYALFISLELTTRELMQRAFSMAAHINARKSAQVVGDTWTEAEMLRFHTLRTSTIAKHVTVCEIRNKICTMADISRVVGDWKRKVKRETGSDEKCKLVLLDWLDLLAPEIQNARRKSDGAEWELMNTVTKDLKRMQAQHHVACWTVTQGNRGSSTADKLRLEHTATSFQKIWYVAVALGLTAPAEDKFIDEGVSDDNLASSSAMDCNRTLMMTIMKNRSGPKFSQGVYQGPTLKFWPSKAMWQATSHLLEQNDMRKIFGNMVK